jgi:methylenetetrahydrofolate dehydrogenase (NADP+)/methenyltetrahydrofolate cyclohydrolase
MSAIILDGRKRADEILKTVRSGVRALAASTGRAVHLVSLQIGEDASSSIYINAQKKIAANCGIRYEVVNIRPSFKENKIISIIQGLNSKKDITGIIVQLPLPNGLSLGRIYSAISPAKDAEGVHPQNIGRLFSKGYIIASPTASAVMELIKSSRIDVYGKETVIINHSYIVGRPLSMMLLNEFATVSVCHIATSQKGRLIAHIKRAEILISAVGRPNLIKGQWIKKGALVIDVGINKVGASIVGDVEFKKAKQRASFITPVPGGVGPLTTAILMRNCLALAKLQRGIR